MKFKCEIYEAFVRTEIACVCAIQSKNVATLIRQYEFESIYLRFFSKKLMQKSFTEDHIDISVFIVCFILSSCH